MLLFKLLSDLLLKNFIVINSKKKLVTILYGHICLHRLHNVLSMNISLILEFLKAISQIRTAILGKYRNHYIHRIDTDYTMITLSLCGHLNDTTALSVKKCRQSLSDSPISDDDCDEVCQCCGYGNDIDEGWMKKTTDFKGEC